MRVFKHPKYNAYTTDNDFALVKLKKASTIKPVAMDHGHYATNYFQAKTLWTIGKSSI